MRLVLPSPRADPWQVALQKGWSACELLWREWGEDVFWQVWDGNTKDGPLLNFKTLLQEVSLADNYRAAGRAWRVKRSALQLLRQGLQAHDLEWVSKHRPGLKDAASIDVALARQIAGRLPAHGPREALESVMVGDMVVRHLTKHWQEHNELCQCGLAEETVDHVLWHCPRYMRERLGAGRCGEGAGCRMQACQRLLGAPALLPELAVWRSSCKESTWSPPPWKADELYVDGSGRQPKEPSVRVIGWAICGKVNGVWRETSGWLEPGSTVAAGEAAATATALGLLSPGGLVVTDRQAVKRMWDRIRRKPGTVSAAAGCLPYWVLLAEGLQRHPTARCAWMRSHRSAEEAAASGIAPA